MFKHHLKIVSTLAAAALFVGWLGACQPAAAAEEQAAPPRSARHLKRSRAFWRIDMPGDGVLPRNFRTAADPFKPAEKRYSTEVDPDFIPSREGLDTLPISGSAQFSEAQLPALVKELQKHTSGPIYDVDLRQESHGFVNGKPVSFYGKNNWASRRDSHLQALLKEKKRLGNMEGKHVKLYRLDAGKKPMNLARIEAKEVLDEEELVTRAGMRYVRLTCTDHMWPQASEIDRFIRFYRSLPQDAWLHFHCAAGQGRTTTFMVFYDMMKNPDVPYKDILVRQYRLGGVYAAFGGTGVKGWKVPLFKEKKRMMELFYKYVQENYKDNYATPWSQWLNEAAAR
jgi:hypothetical protein